MVKKIDLRPGNWLIDETRSTKGGPRLVKVETIGEKGVNEWNDNGTVRYPAYADLKPLVLTYELLAIVGYQGSPFEPGPWISPEVNGSTIRINAIQQCEFFYSMNVFMNPIEVDTLHQLQNLHYALLQKELEVDFQNDDTGEWFIAANSAFDV